MTEKDENNKLTNSPEEQSSKEQVLEAAVQLDPAEQMEFVSEMMTSISMQGPMPNPILAKVNDTHITDTIQAARDHDERSYTLAKQRESRKDSNRKYLLAVLIILLIAVALACWGFKDNTEVLSPLLAGLFGLGAGGIGGYGMGKIRLTPCLLPCIMVEPRTQRLPTSHQNQYNVDCGECGVQRFSRVVLSPFLFPLFLFIPKYFLTPWMP